jgi:hypothetical protein
MGNTESECDSASGAEDRFASLRALGGNEELTTAVLAYLVHSGRVKLVSGSSDSAETSHEQNEAPDNFEAMPNPVIRKSDIYQLVKTASTFQNGKGRQSFEKKMPNCVRQRETFTSSHLGGFSPAMKVALMSRFLPNAKKYVKEFDARPNGGVFSNNGSIFMSSCQGYWFANFFTRVT